jgi:histidinol-phosphate aminotransferase
MTSTRVSESSAGYRPGRTAADLGAPGDVVKLSSNELAFGALPSVAEAIVRATAGADGINRYPDFTSRVLRAAIAERHGLGADHVAVGCGSSSMIGQLCLALADAGDEVVTGTTTFDLYRIAAGNAGAAVVRASMPCDTFDVDSLLAAVTGSTRIVFVANPNNPTSTALPRAELDRLLARLPERCVLAVDEAYIDFADDPAAGSLDSAVGSGRVAVLRTFSKAHGLAGLRVGYLLAAPALVRAVEQFSPPFQVNAVAQAAASASLAATSELAERIAGLVAERRRVTAHLTAAGWPPALSQANFVWLPFRSGSASVAAELEQHGVITRAIGDQGLRVTIGSPGENDRFLEALDESVGPRAADLGRAWEGWS